MRDLSANLKRLRKARKLSKQRISDMIGVGRTTYSTWENGQEPKLRWVIVLAKFHKITIEELIKTDNIQGGNV